MLSGISSSLSASYPAGATEAELLTLRDDELTELDDVPLEIYSF
jgi:hypothetical protein